MNKNNWNKVILVLLVFCMAFAVMPASLAQEVEGEPVETVDTETETKEILPENEPTEKDEEKTASEAMEPTVAPEIPAYTGSASNPHPITNKWELASIGNDEFGRAYPLDGNYIQTQDIVFTEEDFQPGGDFYNDGKGWKPIGSEKSPFKGQYNGGSHSIFGLIVNRIDEEYIGIFGCGNQNTVLKNIRSVNNEIIGRNLVAGIIGSQAYIIENCYNSSSVIAISGNSSGIISGNFDVSNNRSLGLIGADAYISNCENSGFVSGIQSAGIANGLYINGQSIKFCKNTGRIEGRNGKGTAIGIVYRLRADCTVEFCYNTGEINAPVAAGISGSSTSNCRIQNCFNSGIISGKTRASGIVGNTSSLGSCFVDNCFNYGEIYGEKASAGIIATVQYHTTISNSYNTGKITSNTVGASVGGIIGQTSVYYGNSVQNAYNAGNLTTDNTGSVGSLIGSTNATVHTAGFYFDTNVSGSPYAYLQVTSGSLLTSEMTGNEAFESMDQLNNHQAFEMTEDGYPELKVFKYSQDPFVREISRKSVQSSVTTPDPVPADSVKIDPEELELNIDEEYQLMATVTPANATNKNVTWTSDDTSIATVDNTGKVVAIAPGEATITVITEDGGHTATCQVIVKAPTDIEPIWINDTEEGTGNNQIEYTGVWNFSPSKSGCYQNDDHASNRIGAFFTVRFEGTQIKWIGMKNTTCGMAEIYIDDVLVETVDTYSATRDMQQVLFDSGTLPDGPHNLKVVVIEDMNPASTARYITADAFWILPSGSIIEPTTVTINDTETGTDNDKIEYVGNWWHQAQSGNYMDDEHVTNSPDSYFQVRFEGTGIKWYSAFAHDRGIAAVYIDDVFVQYVDCYKLEYEPSSLVFDSGPLTNGQHSLKVVLTNDKNPAATNGYTTVDKLIITK